jgi:hypothetical protein
LVAALLLILVCLLDELVELRGSFIGFAVGLVGPIFDLRFFARFESAGRRLAIDSCRL